MKKSGRKLLGILLAASMAVTTMFPVQGLAAEGNGNGYEGTEEALAEGATAESPEEGQQPVDGNADSEAAGGEQQPADDGVNPEMQAGEQQPADGGTNPEIQSGEQQPEETKPEMLDGEQQLEEANPEASEGKQEAAEEGQKPADEGGKQEDLEEGQKPADEGEESNSSDRKPESAEEGAEPEAEEEGQKPEGGSEPEAWGKEQESDDEGNGTEEKAPEDRQADGEEPEEEAGQPAGGEQGTEEAKMGTFMLPQRNGEEGIMPLGNKEDIDAPVIESFEFKENEQALTMDDTLHFSMLAYDADSGINSVTVQVFCGVWKTVPLRKSEEKNLYEGALFCGVLEGKNGYISSICVEDMSGNCTYANVNDENFNYRYQFTLDYKEDKPEVVEDLAIFNFEMQKNPSNEDGKLRVGDTVTYTADFSYTESGIKKANIFLRSYANATMKVASAPMEIDAENGKLTGTFTVTEEIYPSSWKLASIDVNKENGRYIEFFPAKIEPAKDLSFEVVQENFDTKKPVIESVSIDKNGQWVTAGDTITITAKVKEENPVEYADARLEPQVLNVNRRTDVKMKFNADTNEYVGTVEITEDTYPCEWALTSMTIPDKIGHKAFLTEFKSDLNITYPWYYKVKSGDTYREDFRDITFELYGFAKQEDGRYKNNSLISNDTIRVGRRATLNSLGIFPEPIEGVNTEWLCKRWSSDAGIIIDGDSELYFSGYDDLSYTITATYDKVCANVLLTYMSKDSGKKSAYVPVFVEEGASYKDALDELQLPEDAQTDEFVKFELGDSYDENTLVGDIAEFSAEAIYNNCQVAWNAKYVGKDGQEASKLITKSYLEGTAVSDALADLENPELPSGIEFESWVLLAPDGEQTITQPMANMDIVAIYRGKTTVNAAYTYRGGDGVIASASKMVLIDGEDLSDAEIQGGATEVFKDVEHLSGLRLLEWKSTVTMNQNRYMEVQFQAFYYNCVVTLKFPDNTCQYIVVEKGMAYTLPTENEKYIDIVWEGHGKGEKVVISEDTEFTIKECTDRPKEETGGVRLSDEEIAEVIEKIKNAPEGATIPIDMKKATVIPKEVQEAIQGKSVNIVLQMDGYSWTLNGMDVAATNLKDIDLEVKIDTNAIPSNIVASIAGDSPTTQLSLTHNGDFGFRANLSLNLGSEHAGSTGNLYYYDSDGKLIFINAGQIGADGTTSLPFSHASDYVIVIDKKSSNTDPADKDGDSENKDPADNDGDSPKEEDENPEWDGENLPGKEDEDFGEYEEKDSSNGRTDELATIKRKPTNPVTDSNAPNTAKTDSTGSGNSAQFKSPKTGE